MGFIYAILCLLFGAVIVPVSIVISMFMVNWFYAILAMTACVLGLHLRKVIRERFPSVKKGVRIGFVITGIVMILFGMSMADAGGSSSYSYRGGDAFIDMLALVQFFSFTIYGLPTFWYIFGIFPSVGLFSICLWIQRKNAAKILVTIPPNEAISLSVFAQRLPGPFRKIDWLFDNLNYLYGGKYVSPNKYGILPCVISPQGYDILSESIERQLLNIGTRDVAELTNELTPGSDRMFFLPSILNALVLKGVVSKVYKGPKPPEEGASKSGAAVTAWDQEARYLYSHKSRPLLKMPAEPINMDDMDLDDISDLTFEDDSEIVFEDEGDVVFEDEIKKNENLFKGGTVL